MFVCIHEPIHLLKEEKDFILLYYIILSYYIQ